MDTLVEVWGFQTNPNDFVPKEIAIQCGQNIIVILIKPPFPFGMLSRSERHVVAELEKSRGLRWDEGYIAYNTFKNRIEFLKDRTIFVKGRDKADWLRNILREFDDSEEILEDENNNVIEPTIVHNLELFDMPAMDKLHRRYRSMVDSDRCQYHAAKCAYVNVRCMMRWCKENRILD